MAELEQCKRCDWLYMQEMASVRPPPWTDDDAGMMFQACEKCGNISIQKFSPGGGASSVWMLTRDAMVMFRQGAPPSTVSKYLFSEDFARNRGITLQLFRGYLASMLDLSGFVNVIISQVGTFDEASRVELCLDMVRDVVREFLRRGDDSRLAIRTLQPLVELMRAQRGLVGRSGSNRVSIRIRSVEILETFAQPAVWRSVPADEMRLVEEALDHQNMVDESIARLTAMSRTVDDDALLDAYVEGRFLYKLFRRRQARLSRAHAAAVWRLMRAIDDNRSVGSPVDFATKAFDALRGLLEHQLVESGFFKLGKREDGEHTFMRFKSPDTGEVLAVPTHATRLQIFADDRAAEPSVTLDSWTSALDRV